jgi:hypothetical protein
VNSREVISKEDNNKNNNNNIATPQSSNPKVAMANEAVSTFSKILLVHHDLLDLAPTMD